MTVAVLIVIMTANVWRYNIVWEFVVHFVVLMDITTNFICVILSFDYYKRYYLKWYLCGLLHSQCIRWMTSCGKRSSHSKMALHLDVAKGVSTSSSAESVEMVKVSGAEKTRNDGTE